MILYGYDLEEGIKFEVSVEKICQTINEDGIFSDYEYVYTTEEDRDFHFNENVKEKTNDDEI
mgnify:CR=1 FL=1